MKKLFTTILLAMMAIASWADCYDCEIDGIHYELTINENTAEVESRDAKYSGSIVIPESVVFRGITYTVTEIRQYAFYDCSDLTSVTIPNSVKSIEMGTFQKCSALTNVSIPNSVTNIGKEAFQDCESLTSVNIPNSVTNIGEEAFAYCSSLKSVTIPNSVKSISIDAFSYCYDIESITVESDNTIYDSRDNCNAIIEKSSNTLIAGCKNTLIPNSVTSIGWGAFCGCYGLTSISIPNSVTSIGRNAFGYCYSLNSVSFPISMTSIGDYAFEGCSGLKSVAIPYSVTSIGQCAFGHCHGIESFTVDGNNTIYDSRDNCNAIIEKSSNTLIAGCKNTLIPNSITTIGSYAFYYCLGLTSINIPNSVTSIGSYAFFYCHGLKSVAIPNSVTNIGSSAFYLCKGLTSVIIPNSMTSIGRSVFGECYSLNSVTIPKSVKNIAENAFAYCKNLETMTCYATSVPDLGTTVFKNSNVSNATLRVPSSSVSLYKAADQWKEFGTILGFVKCAKPTISYSDKKLIYSTETEGAEVISAVTVADAKTSSDLEVPLTATYEITAYATKAGDVDSDLTTATLVWATDEATSIEDIDCETQIKSLPLLITQNGGVLTISGITNGNTIAAYTVDGTSVAEAKAVNKTATLDLSSITGQVVVLKVGNKTAKVMVK